MPNDSRDAADRARARSLWPLRFYDLGREPNEDLSASTTPEQRLAMVESLTAEAWSLTGRPMSSYSRASMPVTMRPHPA